MKLNNRHKACYLYFHHLIINLMEKDMTSSFDMDIANRTWILQMVIINGCWLSNKDAWALVMWHGCWSCDMGVGHVEWVLVM